MIKILLLQRLKSPLLYSDFIGGEKQRINETRRHIKASAVGDEIIFSWPLIKHLERSVSLRESECANEVEACYDDCNQHYGAIKSDASDAG